MGMDGISIANTGVKESTSAEFTNRTEQAMNADPANSSRQVQGLSTNQRVREKDEEEESGGKQKGKQEAQETFEDGLVEEPLDDDAELDEAELNELEEITNSDKEFYVKLNIKDDIIELYDSSTDRLIETISGEELGELVKKLNMASGIFVNKRV